MRGSNLTMRIYKHLWGVFFPIGMAMGWFGLGLTIPKPNHYLINLISYNPNQTIYKIKPNRIEIGKNRFGSVWVNDLRK